MYASSNVIRKVKSKEMRWTGHVAFMGEKGNAYGVLVRKAERKRPPGRPRCIWQGNVKMVLEE